jgi:hypothetical protein
MSSQVIADYMLRDIARLLNDIAHQMSLREKKFSTIEMLDEKALEEVERNKEYLLNIINNAATRFQITDSFSSSSRPNKLDLMEAIGIVLEEYDFSLLNRHYQALMKQYNTYKQEHLFKKMKFEGSGHVKKVRFAKKYLKGCGIRASAKNVKSVMDAMDSEGVVFN